MQPNVANKVKPALQQTPSPALPQQIEPKEIKEPKRLQQHKLLKVLKLHFKEFLGTLSYQIKHTTVKTVTCLSKCPKAKIAIFYSNDIHFRGPNHLLQNKSQFD